MGQEGNESAQGGSLPAAPSRFSSWGHLAGGVVGRCCVSEGTLAGTVLVTFQGDIWSLQEAGSLQTPTSQAPGARSPCGDAAIDRVQAAVGWELQPCPS